jgi:hypothetical protein
MMSDSLTFHSWRECLERQGHVVKESEDKTVTGFHLLPSADTIITVAIELDGTLYRRYRSRYFLCQADAERVLRLFPCLEAQRDRWLELVSCQPPGYWRDFLAGPGSWLLGRLTRFREVVAWANHGLSWAKIDTPTHRRWGMEVPAGAAPVFAAYEASGGHGPLRLAVNDERFPDALAACILHASVGMWDWYLADATGREVYLAHHHDQVVASVPSQAARHELLEELSNAPWLFTDESGYN